MLGAGALMASACATDDRGGRALAEIGTLSREVQETRRLTNVNTRELTALAGQVKGIEAEQDKATRAARAAQDESAGLRAVVEALRAEARARPATPPPAPAPAPTTAPAPTPAAPAMARPGATPADAERLYESARANFRAREHGQAVLELLDLLARFSQHRLAPAAQLMIGEAYYQQRDFRQALAEFTRVLERYPKSAEAAEARLKVGLCHRGLAEPGAARRAWEQLVAERPDSTAAAEARALLAASPGRPSTR